MTLRIGANIEDVIKHILGDPGNGIPPDPILAGDIARDGLKAIFSGTGPWENGVVTAVTEEWKTLMLHFAPENSRELERLCGQDRDFNGSEWGKHCLAYIAGDSGCTSETTMATGTKRSMLLVDQFANPPRRMLEILDAEGADLERIDMEIRAAEALNAPDAKAEDTKTEDLINTQSPIPDTPDDEKQ
jgi:hypothetical protein